MTTVKTSAAQGLKGTGFSGISFLFSFKCQIRYTPAQAKGLAQKI